MAQVSIMVICGRGLGMYPSLSRMAVSYLAVCLHAIHSVSILAYAVHGIGLIIYNNPCTLLEMGI